MKTTLKELTTKEMPSWCPACVMPGTLIHTNPSAKKIEEIKEGDRVLGKDGKYHDVTEIMIHMHKGDVFRITAKCFGETVITGEHPVLISKRKAKPYNNSVFDLEWAEAKNVREGDYLPYPILKEVKDTGEIELPAKRKEMDRKHIEIPKTVNIGADFLRLAGYYIAEGYCHSREACLTFGSAEMKYAEDVKDIVQRLFALKAAIKAKGSKINVEIRSSLLAESFAEWFGRGAQNKKIPHFMMLLPAEKQKELIKGMWRGDGWLDRKVNRASYKTISPILKEQIKQLLLRQGIVPTVSINKAYDIHKESYSIEVVSFDDMAKLCNALEMVFEARRSESHKPPIQRDENYAYLPIRRITKEFYDGPVHNMEVAEVNSYVSGSAILHNCGDFNILFAIKNALTELDTEPENIVIVSGIGCGSKTPHFIKTYGFEGLHGRAAPVATGIKLANKGLKVIVVGGDGDGYGIGAGHLLHTMRRNLDITYLVQNNAVYGLTKGQYSPTSKKGFRSPSTPSGSLENEVNPMLFGLAMGATYVARGYAYEVKHLQKLIVDGVRHKGFSIIDIFQPCSTYNKIQTIAWYKQNLVKMEDIGHDANDFNEALKKAAMTEKLPIGLFYKTEKPTYEDGIPQVSSLPLVKHDINNIDIKPLLGKFK
ncbi:MAG: hypothetical protein HY364_01875 [Candidatus Aenigmarchaeota archaeon]|nr:hypothetical protein [Candidatus Aenigmarchaeota archaeon]